MDAVERHACVAEGLGDAGGVGGALAGAHVLRGLARLGRDRRHDVELHVALDRLGRLDRLGDGGADVGVGIVEADGDQGERGQEAGAGDGARVGSSTGAGEGALVDQGAAAERREAERGAERVSYGNREPPGRAFA